MQDLELVRCLRQFTRTVNMLRSDLGQGHLNHDLLVEIESLLDNGPGMDERCAGIVAMVDYLRESTLTPRKELFTDTIRACDKLKDAITDLVDHIG